MRCRRALLENHNLQRRYCGRELISQNGRWPPISSHPARDHLWPYKTFIDRKADQGHDFHLWGPCTGWCRRGVC